MDIFVFGPLADPATYQAVTGNLLEGRRARLEGHALRGAPDDVPGLVAQPSGAVEGVVVAPPEGRAAQRLAAYHTALGATPRMAGVTPAQGPACEVMLHATPPEQGAPEWDAATWRAGAAARWALMAGEIADHQPALDPASFDRQRGMIAARAEARRRAAAEPAPAELRHPARPNDSEWREVAPPAGQFFRLSQMRLSHRRFDGGRAEDLPREVLVGVDAALVLPYDPRRDRLLMVEQFRSGPARRGAANPWCLEPVAGIVDAGESPAEAALRETREEAGLTLGADRLIPIFAGYPSPGSSTDYFHCFLALADLPQDEGWHGGLEEEHEDLRLHVVGFDRAMALTATGEIDVLPMLAMLHWLAQNRARLRAEAGMRDA